jgi:cobalt-zinc-cadmium efflux system protein
VALSAHVVVADLDSWQELLPRLRSQLEERYQIEHVTLQPEIPDPEPQIVALGSPARQKGIPP